MAWFAIAPDFDEDDVENWLLPVFDFVLPSPDPQQNPDARDPLATSPVRVSEKGRWWKKHYINYEGVGTTRVQIRSSTVTSVHHYQLSANVGKTRSNVVETLGSYVIVICQQRKRTSPSPSQSPPPQSEATQKNLRGSNRTRVQVGVGSNWES